MGVAGGPRCESARAAEDDQQRPDRPVSVGGGADILGGWSRELQFRSEFFNGVNHPQFGLPNAVAGVGGAGTIASTQRANQQIQFALRFAY
ncbi:MAG: hypothetical protein C5B51_13385 [Terriglobia bacterium]|nr:MAG: hypothetical protein C5B51_13385 [Terriglobia bacterium]